MNKVLAVAILRDWGDAKYAHKAAIMCDKDGKQRVIYPGHNSLYRFINFESFRGANCTKFYLELVYG